MVNYPNYLSGSQDEINKRLLHMILELKKSEGADITALETAVGDSTSGLVKDVADVQDAIGTETKSGTILYRIKTLETAAGSGGSGQS